MIIESIFYYLLSLKKTIKLFLFKKQKQKGIRGCMVNATSKSAHLSLINACDDFISPTQKMISLTRSVLPTIIDEIKAIQLRNCTNQLNTSLNELKTYLAKIQQVCGSFEAEAMIESIHMLDHELSEVRKAALITGTLRPLPGECLEVCEAQLAAVSKNVGLSMAQMLTAAAQGNEVRILTSKLSFKLSFLNQRLFKIVQTLRAVQIST